MSANVDVPYTQRSVSALSQRRTNPANARAPQPISDSMVRERLSVNLPDRFHYLHNTVPMGRHRAQHHRHHRRSTSSGSDQSGDNGKDDAHSDLNDCTSYAPPLGHDDNADDRTRTERRSNVSSDDSGSDSDSGSDDDAPPAEEEYAFYARLVKLGRGDGHDGAHPAAGAPLVAQCCDTVRGTVDLLDEVRLSTGDAADGDRFFWLDLHGVPPPLPGSAEWGQRPRRWQRKQHAALRAAAQAAAQSGGGRPPEVEMRALWTALGLQGTTIEALAEVCQQRQLNPRPERTSLDDVYEEETVGFACPDDRVLHVEPLAAVTEVSLTAQSEPISPENRREAPPRAGLASARLGATHYVVMELATLLTSVPATATSTSAGAWSSTFLSRAGPGDFANEPLNDAVWSEAMGRGMHAFSPGIRDAAAAAVAGASRRGGLRAGRGGRGNRQLAPSTFHPAELATTPLVTSTYVICFPGGCVTWCPGSTLGLVSAVRREKRLAAAQQRRHRWNSPSAAENGTPAPLSTDPHHHSGDDSSDADADVDDGLEVHYVKSWERLQASVFQRLRHMASRKAVSASCGTPAAAAGAASLCTSGFVALLLSTVFDAYLPNTSVVLDEVNGIDSMLSVEGSEEEGRAQADALRRVLLLRRRLSVHRRLLFQKARLLEALDKPAMHTFARFVRTARGPTWPARTAEQTYGGGGVSNVHDGGDASATCFPAAGGKGHAGGRKRNANASRSRARMGEPPSLDAIHKGMLSVLRNLEAARTVLGNTTLIYSSKKEYHSARTSVTSDYFVLVCQYVFLIVLPLHLVAAHWGMNCMVPFKDLGSVTPFWTIVGIILFLSVAGVAVPIYAYRIRRIEMIA
ncbi:hypothetical protein ABB37_05864 [Leptomonas pyrrhocoris]|uniref:Uncharacterized protein n=1 Tax=Leptomonas pyrrhocoris TaxID=157538 RepID=A0A0M9FYK6_LEPPY|nr:hypothetical protein ABB37_05864 [Leptomonas pyrrhocoris]XP_015657184.1 hypothetical protein ABB37_05864 [Leptomonas pyrrhocoris]KPA78744.1 hypothetical protein ABB37_05864 [Leptomonas pyrrhocoris]KPA78745.1 hypothetical protein ABB37_05864 [Leptomonas pyrrhocoris]|eukprot:XP_015657183.1 hypothetical protein ABB37_05864 [Leptomonas pyrrhocoris]